jgi:hypothetical protein
MKFISLILFIIQNNYLVLYTYINCIGVYCKFICASMRHINQNF